MKTFEEEYSELVSWAKKQREETSKIPSGTGLDGDHAAAVKRDTFQWNRRLIELKVKYGRPLNQQEEKIQDNYRKAGIEIRAVLDDIEAKHEEIARKYPQKGLDGNGARNRVVTFEGFKKIKAIRKKYGIPEPKPY